MKLWKRIKKWWREIATVTEPPVTEEPPPTYEKWRNTGQDVWWPMACMNIGSNYRGASQEVIDRLHEFADLDPLAPMHMRPFGIMHYGGKNELQEGYYDQFRQHMAAGFRMVHVAFGGIDDLEDNLREMNRRGIDLREVIVSANNELDLNEHMPVDEYRAFCKTLLPRLAGLNKTYGCRVAFPALASIRHAVGEYGKVQKEVAGKYLDIFVCLDHNYGRIQPRYYVEADLKERMEETTGMPVILSENGNRFSGADATAMKDGTDDEQAEEYAYAMAHVAVQTGLPVCPFLWEHHDPRKLYLDDISHPVNGKHRRQGLRDAKGNIQVNGPGNVLDTYLDDPRGKTFNSIEEMEEALGLARLF